MTLGSLQRGSKAGVNGKTDGANHKGFRKTHKRMKSLETGLEVHFPVEKQLYYITI